MPAIRISFPPSLRAALTAAAESPLPSLPLALFFVGLRIGKARLRYGQQQQVFRLTLTSSLVLRLQQKKRIEVENTSIVAFRACRTPKSFRNALSQRLGHLMHTHQVTLHERPTLARLCPMSDNHRQFQKLQAPIALGSRSCASEHRLHSIYWSSLTSGDIHLPNVLSDSEF